MIQAQLLESGRLQIQILHGWGRDRKLINIGYIDDEDATLYLKPLLAEKLNQQFLGLDSQVLHSKVLSYAYITIDFATSEFKTTRLFWKRNSATHKLHANDRSLTILEFSQFGLEKAIIADVVATEKQLELFHNNNITEVIVK